MKLQGQVYLTPLVIPVMAISLPTTAQEEHANHHYCKLFDLGSFGGVECQCMWNVSGEEIQFFGR